MAQTLEQVKQETDAEIKRLQAFRRALDGKRPPGRKPQSAKRKASSNGS